MALHNPAPPEPLERARLESWKEIASYLKRETRTVQRWGWARRTTLVQFIWVLEDQERR